MVSVLAVWSVADADHAIAAGPFQIPQAWRWLQSAACQSIRGVEIQLAKKYLPCFGIHDGSMPVACSWLAPQSESDPRFLRASTVISALSPLVSQGVVGPGREAIRDQDQRQGNDRIRLPG